MAIETSLTEFPGVVNAELGQFQLMPGPKGEQGERGPRGYGIESAVLNEDFTLTLRFEDGTSFTTAPIRGPAGERGPRGEPGPAGQNGVGLDSATDITGILKGNGKTVEPAVAGTDYVSPSQLTEAIQRAVADAWEASY